MDTESPVSPPATHGTKWLNQKTRVNKMKLIAVWPKTFERLKKIRVSSFDFTINAILDRLDADRVSTTVKVVKEVNIPIVDTPAPVPSTIESMDANIIRKD